MRKPRIYEDSPALTPGITLALGENGSGHVGRVLRMRPGMELTVFNGTGTDYDAVIREVTRRAVTVEITSSRQISNESPCPIRLGQVISRGEKMDFTIQKSVELGVARITPLISRRCGVKLPEDRLDRKQSQWQATAIAACEQCGRSVLPQVDPVTDLEDFLVPDPAWPCIMLHPGAPASLGSADLGTFTGIRLLIGPEGGLSPEEAALALEHGCTAASLGPRILRTETAGLVAIAILQSRFGDLG